MSRGCVLTLLNHPRIIPVSSLFANRDDTGREREKHGGEAEKEWRNLGENPCRSLRAGKEKGVATATPTTYTNFKL